MLKAIQTGAMGLMVTGAMMFSTGLAAPAHANHHMAKKHHKHAKHHKHSKTHKHSCSSFVVKGKMAYLQHMPSANSKRYGSVKHGTKLMAVTQNGYTTHSNGWYLVKTAMGHRYWVHRSVLSCTAHTSKHAKHHAHKKHAHSKHHAKKHHKKGCATVHVSSKWAQGKAMASMGSKTLRNLPMGEHLSIQNNMGHSAKPHKGYWLVKSNNGHRYWVHQSQLNCSK